VIDEADRLYGLALEEFTAQRDALAKALRAEGRRDDADAVKALRKPTAAVWAVNQAMRTQRKAARRLVQAADRAAANPGDRAALQAHGNALEELTDAASGLLSGGGRGLSDDALTRVRSALHAASLDRGLRDDFAAGRLTSEPSPAGFGAITAAPRGKAKPAPKPKPAPKRPSPAARRRVDRAEQKMKAAREALEQALRDLDAARARLDD
jgi:hypothetical protein